MVHWPISAASIRPYVPESLKIQEFEDTSWVGIFPFLMQGVMRRPFPDLPGISAFPELNVRLYVQRDDRPGIWFLSLDAANRLAVWTARKFFHLPYFHADMKVTVKDKQIQYRSQRLDPGNDIRFRATYQPISEVYEAAAGTLEHWLTERYCLYAQSPDGALWRTEVHHLPWPLQRAEAIIEVNEMVNPWHITLSEQPALLHFAKRLDVVVWPPEQINAATDLD